MSEKDNAGIIFPPPLIFIIIFIIGFFIHTLKPLDIGNGSFEKILFLLGFVLAIAALILNFLAMRTFRIHHTSIVPVKPSTYFVKEGVYSLTRNPMYLALCLLYLGATFIVNSIWTLLLLPVCILIIHVYVIKREEEYLERKFGNEYLDYCSKVHRWI